MALREEAASSKSETSGEATASKKVELQLPSQMGYEKIAMNTAANLARLMGFSNERIEDLKTAVAEACINAIEHGNKLDRSLRVGVILSAGPGSLEVKVTDSGEGPSSAGELRSEAPDIDRKMKEQESARGMGMFLIQSLVDEVEWVRSPPDGSYARMVIHLHPAAV